MNLPFPVDKKGASGAIILVSVIHRAYGGSSQLNALAFLWKATLAKP